jgi:hypothetical protein
MSYNTRSKSRQIKLTEDRVDDFNDKPGIFEVEMVKEEDLKS